MKKYIKVICGMVCAVSCAFFICACNRSNDPVDINDNEEIVETLPAIDDNDTTLSPPEDIIDTQLPSELPSDSEEEPQAPENDIKDTSTSTEAPTMPIEPDDPDTKDEENESSDTAHFHDLIHHSANPADCLNNGNIEYWICLECNKTFADDNGNYEITETVIPAHGHTEEIDIAVSATCTEDGKTQGSHCTECGVVLIEQETIPAHGHTEEIDIAVSATCTEDGKTQGSHCTECGAILIEQETIPAHGHTEEIDIAVSATCTEDGKTQGSHCTECGAILIEQETVPAHGHDIENGECNNCDYTDNSVNRFIFEEIDGTYTVIGLANLADGNLVIPSMYHGKAVTAIGNEAFKNNIDIKTVEIPSSIKLIGAQAFYGCKNLTTATFENSGNWVTSVNINGTYTNLILGTPNLNANYLKNTYAKQYWKQK